MKRLLSLLLIFCPIMLLAQSAITVTGTVVDSSDEPLVGASVQVKGHSAGVATDIDGNFSIKAAVGAVLKVSYVGYTAQEIKVANNSPLHIVLTEDTKTLNEVVVTALGIKREQKALSYNVQTVDGASLTANKDANFINSLAGKVAGVNINSSAAGAGAAARVIMRGTKSLTKDDNALYVIDGIPMFNVNTGSESGGTMGNQPGSSSVADINPDDIESMSVLTGPSAAALYGSDAASGVILITTKKGTEGKTKLTYNNSTSFSNVTFMPSFQNIYGNNDGEATSWGKLLSTPSSYDPADFFRTGVTEINSLTFSTGTARNQTFASAAVTNAPGTMLNSSYNRYNFSIRNTAKFLNDKMTLDLGAQYIVQNNKNMVGSGEYFNPLAALYLFPRGEDFDEVRMYERYDANRNINTQYWEQKYSTALSMQNPYWLQNRMNRTAKKQRYMFNASLKYDILPWLYIMGRVRVDNSNTDSKREYAASTRTTWTQGSDKGYYYHGKTTDRSTYADVMASMNRNFIDGRFSVNAQLGASINDMLEDGSWYDGGLLTLPNFFSYGNVDKSTSKPNESEWHDQIQSVFASVELGWDHAYYLTLTGRNDWASMLAYTDKLSYFYPSFGASWVISETFKNQLPKEISYLKIRCSWAEVASSPSRYLTRMQYSYNEQTAQYEWPSMHYNTNLKPENTKSYEIGLNSKFFNNTLSFDITYYKANTYNQTFQIQASGSSGYKTNLIQTGNIQNSGIEAALGYKNQWGDWNFSTGLTYTLNRNKVVRLANGATDPDTGLPIEMEYFAATSCLGMAGGPAIRLYEGGTMGDLYTNQRLRQSANGYIWRDANTGNVELETVDYYKIGSLLPKFNMGWTGSIGWRDLEVSWAVTGRFGGLVVSDTQALLDRYGVSEASAIARQNGGVEVYGNGFADAQNYYETISQAPGTYYTYSATNVRLADLTIGYTIPRVHLHNIADLTLSLTGKNLWMIYCKAPFDPESTSSTTNNFYQGVDYFQQPSYRSYGFNVKLTF
jgi:TonB-linked SusC/RagA family outer membrane protein